MVSTDAEGHFLLPEDDSVPTVVFAHPQGFLRASVEEVRKHRSVRLQRWARIEGVSKALDEPIRQQRVTLQFKRNNNGTSVTPSDLLHEFEARTDESGYFVFPQVPPGTLEVMTWRPDPTPGSTALFGASTASVEAKPGGTNQIAINAPTVSTK